MNSDPAAWHAADYNGFTGVDTLAEQAGQVAGSPPCQEIFDSGGLAGTAPALFESAVALEACGVWRPPGVALRGLCRDARSVSKDSGDCPPNVEIKAVPKWRGP